MSLVEFSGHTAVATAAEDENHGMWALQFGELPALRNVVGKLIVGEDGSRNNVESYDEKSSFRALLRPISISIRRRRSRLGQRPVELLAAHCGRCPGRFDAIAGKS